MLTVLFRLARVLAIVALAGSTLVPAQQLEDYAKGKPGFPNIFAPYTPTQAPSPDFSTLPVSISSCRTAS